MTRLKFKNIPLLILLAIFIIGFFVPVYADNVNKMTKEELKLAMHTGIITILDVRKGRDWSSSEFKIKGAERVDIDNIVAAARKYPKNQTLVLYCA